MRRRESESRNTRFRFRARARCRNPYKEPDCTHAVEAAEVPVTHGPSPRGRRDAT
jgi:hypothetical protein